MTPEVTELAGVAADRARLDERELELIDRARHAGATWAQIAAALGLGSRQAAEQRRQRLVQPYDVATAERDLGIATRIAAIRRRSPISSRWIDADRRWDTRFRRAALAPEAVEAALDADPGSLYALAPLLALDLTEAGARLPGRCRPSRHDSTTLCQRILDRRAEILPGPRSTPGSESSRLELGGLMRRNAGLFVAISLLSGFGSSAMSLVAGIWILDLTGSTGLAALAGLCVYAPVLAGPWLGGLLDRVPRRPLVIAVNLAAGRRPAGLLTVRGPARRGSSSPCPARTASATC